MLTTVHHRSDKEVTRKSVTGYRFVNRRIKIARSHRKLHDDRPLKGANVLCQLTICILSE